MSVNTKMTAIADAIRAKTGDTASLSLDGMATAIAGIATGGGTDLTQYINQLEADEAYDFVVPTGTTKLRTYAFYNDSKLRSITIPSGVKSLGDYCFNGCSGLTSIVIPSGVTSLSDYCFYSCSRLAAVILEQTTVPSVQSSSFNSGPAARTFYLQDSILESYKTATNWSTLYATSGVTFAAMSTLPTNLRSSVSQATKTLYGWT